MNYRAYPYHYPEPTEFFINITNRKCDLYRCNNLAKDCHILCSEHLLWIFEANILSIFKTFGNLSEKIIEAMIDSLIQKYDVSSNVEYKEGTIFINNPQQK